MRVQKAVNFLRGSVRLEAVGPYPERFFNICAARGIRFRRVERVDETTVRVTVSQRQAQKAQALGPSCLCQVTRLEEQGAPVFLRRFRHRYGLLAGLALSLACVLLLSQFILVVEVSGNTTVSEETILARLQDCGLSVGVYGPGVDARAVANRALLELEELSFLSINLHGVRAEVVVREAEPAPEVEPTGVAVDLLAEKGGTVLEVYPLSGVSLVEAGDVVEPGQVLLSGTVRISREQDETSPDVEYGVVAKGTVWARVEESFTATMPLKRAEKAYTGQSQGQWEWIVLGHCFKISPKAFQPFTYYDKIEETYPLTLSDSLTLPLALIHRTALEYELGSKQLDVQTAQAQLETLLEARLQDAIGENGQVLERSWQVSRTGDALTLTLTAACREQIAQRQTNE
jgi:similar to stage IV sporulation protein